MTASRRSPGRTAPWDARARALALSGALLLGACNVPGARVHNLRELHEDSARHVRDARLVSGIEYYIRNGTTRIFGDRTSEEEKGRGGKVSDPLAACLRNVNALARADSQSERVAAAQVSMLAWLAVDDPWKLSREACVRALGAHGARLGAAVPGSRAGPVAGPEEVRSALAALVAALRGSGPLLAPEPVGGEEPAGAPEVAAAPDLPGDLDGACARIESLELDRAGALRVLRAVGTLESGLRLRDPRAVRLRATLRRVESACVAETLLLALKDEPPPTVVSGPGWISPDVRAAAVTACVEAFGDAALGDLLLQLDRERSDPVVIAVLSAVAERGLPEPDEQVPEQARPRLVQRWIDTLLVHAFDNPSGTVRVAAMRALATVSGGELASLREEDWLAWDQAHRPAPGTGEASEASEIPGEPGRP